MSKRSPPLEATREELVCNLTRVGTLLTVVALDIGDSQYFYIPITTENSCIVVPLPIPKPHRRPQPQPLPNPRPNPTPEPSRRNGNARISVETSGSRATHSTMPFSV
jgi:hypothetical protein